LNSTLARSSFNITLDILENWIYISNVILGNRKIKAVFSYYLAQDIPSNRG
jgi:hypothetical protein